MWINGRYLPDADLPPIVLNEEFIRMARDDLPPLPDYLVTILMREPHNLTVHMAKRLARSPSELSYYNSVMEMGKSMDGSMLCNWYTPVSFANSGLSINLFPYYIGTRLLLRNLHLQSTI